LRFSSPPAVDSLRTILRTVWGYESFRPLQAEAMQSILENRDSVVVLPTGGGKSLCFQAPALAMDGLAVVLSPLISLMKDQVDSLIDRGVAAACVNSTQTLNDKRRVADDIRAGRLKLLYVSPEKLMTERMLAFLRQTKVSFFAIDEAHCISDWGHDFRPEYRMLKALKEQFPAIGVHAYTATATERVRHDIARELKLKQPEILVGSFDRPNLVYRVARRTDLYRQVREVIDRHPDDSGIIYCIRRADVDNLTATLTANGLSALPYHAGLDDQTRLKNQDAFINDRARIIVATVAFGMGIDKPDVRYVIHAAAPKSLEHYQQESGRAGRDGLEAECCLLYSGIDFKAWRDIQSDLPPAAYQTAMTVLAGIENFCISAACRHRSIIEYFGQPHDAANCQACDVCLNEVALVEEPLVIAQKILSCVVRLKESFGAEYTAQVLSGSRDQRILENHHEQLSTWGLLAEHGKRNVRDWIEQLLSQGFLERRPLERGDYYVLGVSAEGWRVLRGEVAPRLLRPAEEKKKKEAKISVVSWEGVDRGLFEHLRALRREKAAARGLPPYMIFSDATLRTLARVRPSDSAGFISIHGVGQRKAHEYSADFLQAITSYCAQNGLAMDDVSAAVRPEEPPPPLENSASAARRRAFEMFAEGQSIEAVCQAVGRARSTTTEYLTGFIASHGIVDPSAWIEDDKFARIRAAVGQHGMDKLRPLFDALNGEIGYDELRVACACLKNAPPS
jgi:ATP-dependent DNA helicase RecQ